MYLCLFKMFVLFTQIQKILAVDFLPPVFVDICGFRFEVFIKLLKSYPTVTTLHYRVVLVDSTRTGK